MKRRRRVSWTTLANKGVTPLEIPINRAKSKFLTGLTPLEIPINRAKSKFLTGLTPLEIPINRAKSKFLTGLTDFETSVFKAVCKIPKGQVRSYKWVAEAIGRPDAVRAVGNALNKNPFVGIVPCHRVIASNGGIGGFSRGIKKKRQMLRREGIEI